MVKPFFLGPCYGERGRLTHVGDKIQCHVCGKVFHFLGKHVAATHEISADDYRREFRLHRSLGLVSDAMHRRWSDTKTPNLKNYRLRDPHVRDAYELQCLICAAPIVVRLSRHNPTPVLCRDPRCRAEHTRRKHLGIKESPEACRHFSVSAKARGNAWLLAPEVRAMAARTMRGRRTPDEVRAKLRGPRVARLTLRCVVCGDAFSVRPCEKKKTCTVACWRSLSRVAASTLATKRWAKTSSPMTPKERKRLAEMVKARFQAIAQKHAGLADQEGAA